MPLTQAKSDIRVWIDEDFDSSDVSEDYMGRKAFSLFQLKDIDVPVPPFFAVSGSMYTEFVRNCLGESVDHSTTDEDIRKAVTNGSFTQEQRSEIASGYSRLCGFSDTWVSVRSSVVLPHSHRDLLFAGMLDTKLNVRGIDAVLEAMKEVYSSVFTTKVVDYLQQSNVSVADVKIGIVIQKMVQAEASGVVFTVDPITQDDNYLTVEAVFGLGTVIANGDITPDQYLINKSDFSFKEKKIVPQEWMLVRTMATKPGQESEQKVTISKAWQQQQKVDNRYIIELAALAVNIEKELSKPQDIEWVYEGGRMWLLQTTDIQPVVLPRDVSEPILSAEPALIEAVHTLIEREDARQRIKQSISQKEPPKSKIPQDNVDDELFITKPLDRQVLNGESKKKESRTRDTRMAYSPLPGEKLLITGIGASPSSFRGQVVMIASRDDVLQKKRTLTSTAVMVVSDLIAEIDPYVDAVGAIVSDTGGITSDLSTRCREREIPCIVGCHIASKMLKDGESVLVDGRVGAIYGVRKDIRMQKEQPAPTPKSKVTTKEKPVTKATATKKDPDSGSSMPHQSDSQNTQSKKPIKKEHRLTSATDIFVDISDSYLRGSAWKESLKDSDGICMLAVGDLYKKIGRHPEAYAADGTKSTFISKLSDSISDICELSDGRPIIVSIGDMTVSEYKALTKGNSFENTDDQIKESSQGLHRLLRHPKELSLFFAALRRVRNIEGWRNVSIAVHYSGTPTHIIEFKKQLTAAKLRRSSTFNLYVVIDTPSEGMIVNDFVAAGIDGIIVNTGNLARHMMAESDDDESVLKMIDTIKDNSPDIPHILQTQADSKKLMDTAIRRGFLGIAVPPKYISALRSTVLQLERDVLFRK